MSLHVSSLLLAQFSQFVAERMGLCFPPEREEDLLRGVRSAAREFGFENPEDCLRWLMCSTLDQRQIQILASSLTVGETYFFRDEKTFQILEEQLLPELARTRRGRQPQLRLWSAACCSGEEAYSLAISVRRALPDVAGWRVSILGGDINPRFLARAAAGVFGEWSFRNAPAWLRTGYFDFVGSNQWRLHPLIKRMVHFSHMNLAGDVYPSLLNDTNAMDVIFCRNALIYFTPEQAQKVIRKFLNCLTEGGWLVLGPSETSLVRLPQLEPVVFEGVVLHRKVGARTGPLSRHVPRVEVMPEMPMDVCFEPAAAPASAVLPDRVVSDSVEPEPAARQRSAFDEARRLYEGGNHAGAAGQLGELLSREPHDARALSLMARALANLGQLAAALEWCDRLIVEDKLNPGAHYLRASILQEQDRRAEAATALQRALYLDPDFVLAHFALANLARNAGDFRRAERHFDNALALARRRPGHEVLPESEGVTAGRLSEMIAALKETEMAA